MVSEISRNASDEHSIQDPFRPGRQRGGAILQFLGLHSGWKRNWGPIGYGVCFPASHIPSATYTGHKAGTGNRLVGPAGRRSHRTAHPRGHGMVSEGAICAGGSGAQALITSLNHDVVLEQPLGSVVSGVERSITELSEHQYRILRLLKHRPRLAVSGPGWFRQDGAGVRAGAGAGSRGSKDPPALLQPTPGGSS